MDWHSQGCRDTEAVSNKACQLLPPAPRELIDSEVRFIVEVKPLSVARTGSEINKVPELLK